MTATPWYLDDSSGTVQWAAEFMQTAPRIPGFDPDRAMVAQALMGELTCGALELPPRFRLTDGEKDYIRRVAPAYMSYGMMGTARSTRPLSPSVEL